MDIVRRAKQGDQPAFSLLFQRYRRPVLGFLYGMTGRRDLTEDLLQETLSRAFMLLPELREDSKFSTWLFVIAKNVARGIKRSSLRDHNLANLEILSAEELSDPRPDPETDAIKRQLHQTLNKGLADLDE